jgi:hypothetical protein
MVDTLVILAFGRLIQEKPGLCREKLSEEKEGRDGGREGRDRGRKEQKESMNKIVSFEERKREKGKEKKITD